MYLPEHVLPNKAKVQLFLATESMCPFVSTDRRQILCRDSQSLLVAMDTTAADLSGKARGTPHHQLTLLRRQNLPSSRLLPYKDAISDTKDGTEREM